MIEFSFYKNTEFWKFVYLTTEFWKFRVFDYGILKISCSIPLFRIGIPNLRKK